jgi:O-antigen/teichoic acid export membrane protein
LTTIGSKMAVGATWMVLAKLLERSLGLISTLILARVLIPHDFGIVAMAMSFVALLEMLSAFGFDVVLIQKQTKDRRHWDTAWTFEIIFGLCIAAGMVLFAEPVAKFFREPSLIDVLRVLAIGSAVQGFQNIGLVAFRTEMKFDREFRFLMAKKLIGFVITIPLAFILDSYWALVIGQTLGRVGSTALSYWVHPYRPRLSLSSASDLFHHSKWLLVVNFVNYLKERSSDWVIGRMTGPSSLAAFNVSYEFASLPSTELVAPINRAVFPAYAQLAAQDRSALPREYLSDISVIVLIAVPAILGLAATAPILVPVLLGPNWTEAIPVLTLLAFYGFTNIVQSNAHAAYFALGRTDLPAKINAVHVLVQLATLIPLTKAYGVKGSAIAYLGTAAVMIPISLGVALRMLDISVLRFVTAIWRPVAAALTMFFVVREFLALTAGAESTPQLLVRLLCGVALGMATYVPALLLFWMLSGRPPGAERTALDRVRSVAAPIFNRLRRTTP